MNLRLNYLPRTLIRFSRLPSGDTPARVKMVTLFLLVAFAFATAASVNAQDSSTSSPPAPSAPTKPTRRTAPSTTRAGETAERESSEPRAADGVITGRVTSDDGQPLSNVTVTFMKRSNTNRPSGANAVTGADGKFRAENLDPGAYTVWAYVPGYITARDPGVERGEPRYYRLGDDVRITMTKGGVITGTIRNTNGDPVVAAMVRVTYVRDLDGKGSPDPAMRFGYWRGPTLTDDRGIYRIYNLEPGSYVVSIGGDGDQFFGRPSAHDSDAPTYHPSATRDGAIEVTVQSGQEVTGVDIRHRGERGHTISGKISGTLPTEPSYNYGISLSLTHAATGMQESFTSISGNANDRAFSFDGVADGEYEVAARLQTRSGDNLASSPQRVSVRGTDVTGLNLTLAPLASISGRLTLEAMSESERAANRCVNSARRAAAPSEALVVVRRDEEKMAVASQSRPRFSSRADAAPDADGALTVRGLDAGRYRLEILPPGENWYVRAVNLMSAGTASSTPARRGSTAAGANAQPNAASPPSAAGATGSSNAPVRDAVMLTAGQRVSGITIMLAEGAASLRGAVVGGKEGAILPARMRVNLVPVERERADDSWRYASSPIAPDGSFALTHLAPGRYWLLVAIADNNVTESHLRSFASNAGTRASLRREAEAAANVVDLRPCQHVKDFPVSYVLNPRQQVAVGQH